MHTENVVKQVYGSITPQEISAKIAQLITSEEVSVPVEVIFQTIEDLHDACPGNLWVIDTLLETIPYLAATGW